MTVCERIFRDLKFELPSTCVRRFVVTRDLVDNPAAALQRMLKQSQENTAFQEQQAAHAFARAFSETHGLKIRFTDDAAARLATLAKTTTLSIADFCADRFKDFQFGLKLVSQNTGQKEFVLGPDAVEEPDKVLSGWVVASYRKSP